MEGSDIAIVIPAWNEDETIYKVVSNAKKYGKVIVVDDASTDNTRLAAKGAGAVVVSHKENQGYDKALNTGFDAAYSAGCKYVITIDADGQHNPDLISLYLKYLKEKNIPLVLGIRPKKARLSELIMGLYFKLRFNVHDILCGMKGYNIALYDGNRDFAHRKLIGTELAFWALKDGHRFSEIEVPVWPRNGKPRFGNILKSNAIIFKALLHIIAVDLCSKNQRKRNRD